MTPGTAIVVFNRDLRVHDHPALLAAASFEAVIPLFVFDPSIAAPPNRLAFLVSSLRELDVSLTKLGAPLVVRRGDTSAVLNALRDEHDVRAVFASGDYTPLARRREQRLAPETFPGVALAAPGTLTPTGGDHFKVFTAYWRRWREVAAARPVLAPPPRLRSAGVSGEVLPTVPPTKARVPVGGEAAARVLLRDLALAGYASGGHDDLAGDRTSRLSPYLHFGCVSARECMERVSSMGADGDAFVRQLCWRDFFLQFEAAQPEPPDPMPVTPSREHTRLFAAWAAGRTGYPIVDAGMRQLLTEGWMHNRARMITASFLVHDLGVDWRLGAAHFMHHLVDGDVANNNGNWRWVAGDGLNTRPGRELNPLRQAKRFDPSGAYVRRYVDDLDASDYPAPIIDKTELAAARNRQLT
ncbi:MAG: deoxyribodipyrimidine photo-lyase [Actinomycetota bacterium]